MTKVPRVYIEETNSDHQITIILEVSWFIYSLSKTERYKKSSVRYMQRLLNKEDKVFKSFVTHSNVRYYASELCHSGSIINDNLHCKIFEI